MSYSRKLHRGVLKHGHNLKPGTVLEAENRRQFEAVMTSRLSFVTHVAQKHPTKGLRVRNKKSVAIGAMTKDQRWEMIVRNAIEPAQRHARKAG